MILYVDVEALNLRSRPEVTPATRIGLLHLGQRVERVDDAELLDWARVSAELAGEAVTGYVKASYLRQPAAPAREALIAAAVAEWLRFEKGLGRESSQPFAGYVGEMWRAIGLELDGFDSDVPWSAAAMSFFVRKAAASFALYERFLYAAAHSRFIHDSIVKRQRGDENTPFWGHRLHERRPELGDLVCRWRDVPRDFDDAAKQSAFKSHTDVVVSVGTDHVLGLGGNVDDSVSLTRYAKTGAGFLASSNNVFAHLVNRVR
jgi:hypothetical protein